MSEREIVIRIKFPERPRVRWLVGLCALLLVAAAVAYASVPNTFSPGDSLSSSKMNANFASFDTRLTALETGRVVATIGTKQYSVGATRYVMATPTVFDGNIGGFSGVKMQCESATGSTSAHMCSADEIIRSAQAGVTIGTGWISLANVAAAPGGGANSIQDCVGWTTNTPTVLGTTFSVTNQSDGGCNGSASILCCD